MRKSQRGQYFLYVKEEKEFKRQTDEKTERQRLYKKCRRKI